MLTYQSLGQREAHAALDVGLAMAREHSLLMAFAVTDQAGRLIVCERMDGAPPRILTHAMRKAFTSAEMGRDTALFEAQLHERGGDLPQWGNPQLTTLAGGCVVEKDGQVLGAVGCGGAPLEFDIKIAQAMAAAALS